MNALIKLFSLFLMMSLPLVSCSSVEEDQEITPITMNSGYPRTEPFTFSSGGVDIRGKIYIPTSYEANSNLPAIYLIDYMEQHFEVVTDEFAQVINGVRKIEDLDALVVSLEAIHDIDATVDQVQTYYEVFKIMASYVDNNYTNNTSRTFIGRGSEGGVVMLTLLLESSEITVFNNFIATDPPTPFMNNAKYMIENGVFPSNMENKKLHFSFSSDNSFSTCNALIQAIEDAQYPWLEFESVEYPDDNYEDIYPVAFATGLKFVFDN